MWMIVMIISIVSVVWTITRDTGAVAGLEHLSLVGKERGREGGREGGREVCC